MTRTGPVAAPAGTVVVVVVVVISDFDLTVRVIGLPLR
jgi:hypothetical protein